jgi:glycosyltransferase involved in cell wall biosynthesis
MIAKKVITVAFSNYKELLRVVDRDKLIVIENGADPDAFHPDKNSIKKGIFYLGRKDRYKGLDTFSNTGIVFKTIQGQPYENMPEIIRKAKLIVLPSLYEAQPLVIYEAVASGTPIICTDVGDCKLLLKRFYGDKHMDFIVKVGDEEELRSKIIGYMASKGEYNEMLAKARERLVRDHTWAKVFSRYEKVFRDNI